MSTVKFTEQAETDLAEIWAYVAENSSSSANKLIDEFLGKFRLLANNPNLGKNQSEIIVNLRSFPYKKFNIFYFPLADGVEIYRVLHSARDIETIFTDYFEGLSE